MHLGALSPRSIRMVSGDTIKLTKRKALHSWEQIWDLFRNKLNWNLNAATSSKQLTTVAKNETLTLKFLTSWTDPI